VRWLGHREGVVDGRWCLRGESRALWRVALYAMTLVGGACSSEPPSQNMNAVMGVPPPAPGVLVPPPIGGAGAPGIATAGTGPVAGSVPIPPVMTTMPPPVMTMPPPPPDGDADGVPDESDNCAELANAAQEDGDKDGAGDGCDNCADLANADQADADEDGTGDACACANPAVLCEAGKAGPYACKSVDLLSRLSASDFSATSGNSLWGWTDPDTGRKVGVMGLNNGTGFVDVSVPQCAKLLGKLPTATGNHVSRDVKVMGNHALVVAEARDHGLQIFDLKSLGAEPSTTPLKATANYKGNTANVVGNAHNVAINEDSGFIYIVGARSCGGGLHMVDFEDPLKPAFVGCGPSNGYVHDVQCVNYEGPDSARAGREICFAAQGDDSFTILDVTNKSGPTTLARMRYPNGVYSHQGWLTEDHAYFVFQDELDEQRNGGKTRTFVFDVRDLAKPALLGTHTGPTSAIDHNVVISGDFAYQASYSTGLRIYGLADVGTGKLTEVAFFDTLPAHDSAQLQGAWIAYPFFDNGSVLVSNTDGGFFVLRPDPMVVTSEPR
jgi:choice-of-anchor B domain-containing protein